MSNTKNEPGNGTVESQNSQSSATPGEKNLSQQSMTSDDVNRSSRLPECNVKAVDFAENRKSTDKSIFKKKNMKTGRRKRGVKSNENEDNDASDALQNIKNKKVVDEAGCCSPMSNNIEREEIKKSQNPRFSFFPVKKSKNKRSTETAGKRRDTNTQISTKNALKNSIQKATGHQTDKNENIRSTKTSGLNAVEEDSNHTHKIRPKGKEPLIYNCCMCCSLGAGTLLGGIIFIIFCIAYLVVRAEEFRTRTVIGIWNGNHLLQDVWRVLLVIGFVSSSFCLFGSIVLVFSSCLCGSKEKYKTIRRVIVLWFISAITSLINNVGEAIFIQTMPNIKIRGFYHPSDSIADIKSNNIRLWTLTGLFSIFFIYMTLVLVSYLRMLKYMDSPKIGATQMQMDSKTPVHKSGGKSKCDQRDITREENKVEPAANNLHVQERTPSAPDLPMRDIFTISCRDTVEDTDQIYENTIPKLPILNAVSENKSANARERLPSPRPEAIYVNANPVSQRPRDQYAEVRKPVSLVEKKSVLYDLPPKELESPETQHPGIERMEILTEELRTRQEALNESGHCDSATAEELTQMAVNALKLSEKILQEVKTDEGSLQTPVDEDGLKVEEENLQLAEKFFEKLAEDESAMSSNPIEEMFRMYGKDLCSKYPQMVNRYLKSYKILREKRNTGYVGTPAGPDVTLSNRPEPWMSINSSNEPIHQGMEMTNSRNDKSITNLPRYPPIPRTHSKPSQRPSKSSVTSQHSDSTCHSAGQGKLPIGFFPENFHSQHSGSYTSEHFANPFGDLMLPHDNQKRKNSSISQDIRFPTHRTNLYPLKTASYLESYGGSECPCSYCNFSHCEDDSFDEYGVYPAELHSFEDANSIYNDADTRWFPLGDPAYSIDMYHNPYSTWNEFIPSFTEESIDKSIRSSYNLKTNSKAKSLGNHTRHSRDRSDSSFGQEIRPTSFKSRSMSSILDNDLYSDTFPSSIRYSHSMSNLSSNGTRRSRPHRPNSRSMSQGSNSRDITLNEAFLKGYKKALLEALRTISVAKDRGTIARRNGNESIDRIELQSAGELGSISSHHSGNEGRLSLTSTNDSKLSTNRSNKEDWNFIFHSGSNMGISTGRTSRRNKNGKQFTDKIAASPSRRTSKLSFRPSSRPGQPFFDDGYDDYRITSTFQAESDKSDKLGFLQKYPSRSWTSLESLNARNKNESSSCYTGPLFGRPSTRSRLSSRLSSFVKGDKFGGEETDASIPFVAENDKHFYNKLNLERPLTAPPYQEKMSSARSPILVRSRSVSASRGRASEMDHRGFQIPHRSENDYDRYMSNDESIYTDNEKSWREDSSRYPSDKETRSSSFLGRSRQEMASNTQPKSVTFYRRSKSEKMNGKQTSRLERFPSCSQLTR